MSAEPGTDLVHAQTFDEKIRYAQALSSASLLPRDYREKPANVLLAMEYGEALGISPMVAIQSIHVIEGKPSASAQLIGGLVRRAGHRLRVTGDETSARAEIVRSDDPEFTFVAEWTLDRAKTAGLVRPGGNWAKYPGNMLKARCITEVARDACPEVLSGVAYTPEELGAPDTVTVEAGDGFAVRSAEASAPAASDPSSDVVDAEIVDPPVWAADLEAATTVNEVRDVWGTHANSLTNDGRGALQAAMLERRAAIEAAATQADGGEADAVPPSAEVTPPSDEVVDAELIDPADELLTANQSRGLATRFANLGFADRVERLQTIGLILGRHVESMNHMTQADLGLVTAVLDQAKADPNPPLWLAAYVDDLTREAEAKAS